MNFNTDVVESVFISPWYCTYKSLCGLSGKMFAPLSIDHFSLALCVSGFESPAIPLVRGLYMFTPVVFSCLCYAAHQRQSNSETDSWGNGCIGRSSHVLKRASWDTNSVGKKTWRAWKGAAECCGKRITMNHLRHAASVCSTKEFKGAFDWEIWI